MESKAVILVFTICMLVFGSGKKQKRAKEPDNYPDTGTLKEDEDVLANFSWAGPRSRWIDNNLTYRIRYNN